MARSARTCSVVSEAISVIATICCCERIGLMLSLEGVECFGVETWPADVFHALGARMAGLTWNSRNAFADGAAEEGGSLSRLGRELVWTIGNLGFLLTYAALLALSNNPSMGLLVFMVLVQGALGYGVTSVFGAIPADRLRVANDTVFLRADGRQRGKIGIPRPRVRGVAGSYDPDGHVLTASANGQTVFTLSLTNLANGTYELVLQQPLDHPQHGVEDDIALSVPYTLTDGNGTPVGGNLAILINDDSPTAGLAQEGEAPSLLSHDEGTRGGASESVSADFASAFKATLAYGADGAGNVAWHYSLNVTSQGEASGLSSGGQGIHLYLIDGVVVGSTAASAGAVSSANTVFSLAVDAASGKVTLTQYAAIDHALPGDTGGFDSQQVTLGNDLVQLQGSVTITDRDGDTALAEQQDEGVGCAAGRVRCRSQPLIRVGLARKGGPAVVHRERGQGAALMLGEVVRLPSGHHAQLVVTVIVAHDPSLHPVDACGHQRVGELLQARGERGVDEAFPVRVGGVLQVMEHADHVVPTGQGLGPVRERPSVGVVDPAPFPGLEHASALVQAVEAGVRPHLPGAAAEMAVAGAHVHGHAGEAAEH